MPREVPSRSISSKIYTRIELLRHFTTMDFTRSSTHFPGFNTRGRQSSRMTDDGSELLTEETPTFLSSFPNHPITDDIVRQIGENDHPQVRGARGLPGAEPGKITAFQLDMQIQTYVLVFDPIEVQWRVYESFKTDGMNYDEIVERTADIHNEWLGDSLSDRTAATDESSDK